MIKKIVSGGQTRVDQAALDVAIELSIPHGGWIPKGRKTEDGPLPEKYKLQEMPTLSYERRTQQNVVASHGTLILSHGKLTGGCALTKRIAKVHNRPCLHIDLDQISAFLAASKIINWVYQYGIEVLNVAGPRASKDPGIYDATVEVLRTVMDMEGVEGDLAKQEQPVDNYPKSVEEAVERLIAVLHLRTKAIIANMREEDLTDLHPSLGRYIRNHFGLWSENEALLTSCVQFASELQVGEDSASAIIIRELWKKLRKTHSLRIVK